MGFKYKVPNKTATIQHPTIPDLAVTSEQPDMADIIEWQESLKVFSRREVAVHPDTKEPIYKLGKLQYVDYQMPIPFNKNIELIAKQIRNVTGIEDATFSPAIAVGLIRRFLDPEFNFKEMQEKQILDEEGNPTGATQQVEENVNWGTYLARKVMDPETYGRPLESPTLYTTTATAG